MNVNNTTECKDCGWVQDYRGRPEQIAELLANTKGLCPACFCGYQPKGKKARQAEAQKNRQGFHGFKKAAS